MSNEISKQTNNFLRKSHARYFRITPPEVVRLQKPFIAPSKFYRYKRAKMHNMADGKITAIGGYRWLINVFYLYTLTAPWTLKRPSVLLYEIL